jgi:predicted nucleic acid-binding Zn ribbon protein
MKTISKRRESVCPECGNSEKNYLLISTGAGFVFKGDGFYESTKKNAELNTEE